MTPWTNRGVDSGISAYSSRQDSKHKSKDAFTEEVMELRLSKDADEESREFRKIKNVHIDDVFDETELGELKTLMQKADSVGTTFSGRLYSQCLIDAENCMVTLMDYFRRTNDPESMNKMQQFAVRLINYVKDKITNYHGFYETLIDKIAKRQAPNKDYMLH